MQLKFLIILIPLTTIPGIFCLTQVFSEYSGFFFFLMLLILEWITEMMLMFPPE